MVVAVQGVLVGNGERPRRIQWGYLHYHIYVVLFEELELNIASTLRVRTQEDVQTFCQGIHIQTFIRAEIALLPVVTNW